MTTGAQTTLATEQAATGHSMTGGAPTKLPLSKLRVGQRFVALSDGTGRRTGVVLEKLPLYDAVVVELRGRRMAWHEAVKVEVVA